MSNESKIVSSAVDWITITAVKGNDVDDLYYICQDIVQQWLPNNVLPSKWHFQGYKGKTYGPVRIGSRGEDEAIMIVSGDLAGKVYPGVPLNWDAVTRIDLQTTIALGKQDKRCAIRCHERASELTGTLDDGKLGTLISSATGDSLYIGKRRSSRYLRYYDKSLDYKMEDTGYAWRYEVEYKRDLAKNIAKTVAHMKDPYAEIASLVWAEFRRKGVVPSYNKGSYVSAMETGLKVKTAEGTLSWLERCVSPVITQLSLMGYDEEVAHALRIRDVTLKGE